MAMRRGPCPFCEGHPEVELYGHLRRVHDSNMSSLTPAQRKIAEGEIKQRRKRRTEIQGGWQEAPFKVLVDKEGQLWLAEKFK